MLSEFGQGLRLIDTIYVLGLLLLGSNFDLLLRRTNSNGKLIDEQKDFEVLILLLRSFNFEKMNF